MVDVLLVVVVVLAVLFVLLIVELVVFNVPFIATDAFVVWFVPFMVLLPVEFMILLLVVALVALVVVLVLVLVMLGRGMMVNCVVLVARYCKLRKAMPVLMGPTYPNRAPQVAMILRLTVGSPT